MRVLRWLAIAVGGLAALVALVAFGARFADGPIAIFPGGPFASGEWVEAETIDWSFAEGLEEIELESGEPARSRTTWVVVLDGQAYIPASLSFPPGKTWHQQALDDPRAVVRVSGKRYRRRLAKVDDPSLEGRLVQAARAKYGPPPGSSGIWFFRLEAPGGA